MNKPDCVECHGVCECKFMCYENYNSMLKKRCGNPFHLQSLMLKEKCIKLEKRLENIENTLDKKINDSIQEKLINVIKNYLNRQEY